MSGAESDVVVVGAGAAGIAAARELAAHGLGCLVLEAGHRIGGRAWTDTERLGAPFDLGATWLHEAETNPLSPVAEALAAATGTAIHRSARRRKDGVWLQGRPATAGERAAYVAAIEAWEAAFEAVAADGGPDRACADVPAPPGPWSATAAYWLGEVINGAPLSGISVRDYVAIDLHGSNWQPQYGLGRLLQRQAAGLEIRLGTPVAAIAEAPGGVALDTPRGRLRARAVLVTVSTGVLAGGGIRFTPALPAAVEEACHGLPLGQTNKLALRLTAPELLDLPPFTRLERQLEREGDFSVNFLLRPFGQPYVSGFLGGPGAAALRRQGAAAVEAFARAELARYLGAATVARACGAPAILSDWAGDPLFRGAYTHARPGQAGARAVLRGAALLGGRLRFAGEACHARVAATLGGAWDSGTEAARALAASLGRTVPPAGPPGA